MRRNHALLSGAAAGIGAVALVACSNVTSVGGGAGGSGHGATTVVGTSGPSATTGGAGAGSSTATVGATSTTGSGMGGGSPQARPDKIDLLFAIDNSRSMYDKQMVLAQAIPDFLQRLVNPACIDGAGAAAPTQPAGPLDPCPVGTSRAFAAVLDIHVGIVTSSLGVAGADSCANYPAVDTSGNNGCPAGQANGTEDDHGHLISRQNPCGGADYPSYKNEGFLAWDPAQKLMPPGESNVPTFIAELKNYVLGVGQIGCGFESQNESWYRFLVDPSPYATISVTGSGGNLMATPAGLDSVLLQERADFLRPDSMLAIVTLSDENDASIKEYGQYFYVAQSQQPGGQSLFHLPRARQICQTNPADPCCASCGQNTPPNCPADPTCDAPNTLLTDKEDPINLREWNSKRRFGIEFYYQPDRYVDALTRPTIADNAGNVVPNPLFAGGRAPSFVFLDEIVGVPWQDIARQDADGTPDLLAGLDPSGHTTGGFKTAAELSRIDGNGHSVWDYVVGDYIAYAPPGAATIDYGLPLNPLMIESLSPRVGTDPITGFALAPTSAPSGTNPSNGHEWIAPGYDDIQYACVFDLPQAAWRDCSKPQISCDCTGATNDNPLCAPNPNDNGNPTLQVRAKGYPGIKELAILEGLGPQGVLGSICAKQVSDPTAADYGYRPALASLFNAMYGLLKP